MDPRTPVLVGAAQFTATTTPNEPVDMMTTVARSALADSGADLVSQLGAVRVIRGINPYRDPGRLVADRLDLGPVATGLTQHGGQEAFDVVTRTALDIADGALDAAIVCGAETMRSRRADKRAGRQSDYIPEPEDAAPTTVHGTTDPYWDELDTAAQANVAVHFYAMAENARRHRTGRSVADHRAHISELWAAAARVAADNPHAAVRTAPSAEAIGTASDTNRMVADPYPKLMTSNVNVDMAAAVVLCSAEAATRAGIPESRCVFPLAGSGAYDHWQPRSRWDLDRSPAMELAGTALLEHLDTGIDGFDHIDLYSCFPIAIQVAQEALGQTPGDPFTITGGLTFNGGPFNTYCLHPLVTAVDRVRADGGRAFLSGNGGFFTKHAFLALGPQPPSTPFAELRPQAEVDALPRRPVTTTPPAAGTIESHTTVFARDGAPDHSIVSVLAADSARTWAWVDDRASIDELHTTDAIGRTVRLEADDRPTPLAHLD